MEHAPVADRTPPVPPAPSVPSVEPVAAAATCPFPHAVVAAAPGCPVPHGGGAARPVPRSAADLFVRRVLRIRDRPAGISDAAVYGTFQRSMLISALRCTLTYVVFPFVLPAVGIATSIGPVVGIVIGTFAITCDVFTIRRFFSVDHKYRWHFSALALSIVGLLAVLLVEDVVALAT